MAVVDSERLNRVAINSLLVPGDERIGLAVGEYGVNEAVSQWKCGVGPKAICQRIGEAVDTAQKVLDKAASLGVRFVIPSDADWPEQLADLDTQSPIGLWVKGSGKLSSITADSLAIVGARAATSYGTRIASELGTLAADYERCVVSGAAFGVDAAAHRGALSVNGTTVAVLACGVDVAYPAAHQGLLDRIAATGLIISEVPPGTLARKQYFLIRNRLIAALASQTVVVEAALRSGALSTSNWANAIGRQVWGVPGPITSASSAGVNREIATGQAMLLMSPEALFATAGNPDEDIPEKAFVI
jgi:DNA processing protein